MGSSSSSSKECEEIPEAFPKKSSLVLGVQDCERDCNGLTDPFSGECLCKKGSVDRDFLGAPNSDNVLDLIFPDVVSEKGLLRGVLPSDGGVCMSGGRVS